MKASVDVFDGNDKNEKRKRNGAGLPVPNVPRAPVRGDAAVTAEFDYIDWSEDLSQDGGEQEAQVPERHAAPGAFILREVEDPPTRAVDAEESFLGGASAARADRGTFQVGGPRHGLEAGRGGQGAWGFEQPQVSGVFSRYDEETRESDSGDFDLFAEETPKQKAEQTLRDYVAEHDKVIRRLTRQVAYQKEIIQVISELLVEAQVISREELKRRLRALRAKSS